MDNMDDWNDFEEYLAEGGHKQVNEVVKRWQNYGKYSPADAYTWYSAGVHAPEWVSAWENPTEVRSWKAIPGFDKSGGRHEFVDKWRNITGENIEPKDILPWTRTGYIKTPEQYIAWRGTQNPNDIKSWASLPGIMEGPEPTKESNLASNTRRWREALREISLPPTPESVKKVLKNKKINNSSDLKGWKERGVQNFDQLDALLSIEGINTPNDLDKLEKKFKGINYNNIADWAVVAKKTGKDLLETKYNWERFAKISDPKVALDWLNVPGVEDVEGVLNWRREYLVPPDIAREYIRILKRSDDFDQWVQIFKLKPDEAEPWIEKGFKDPYQINSWMRLEYTAEQAERWRAVEVNDPNKTEKWRYAAMSKQTPLEAAEVWYDAKIKDPDIARDWIQNEYTPKKVKPWGIIGVKKLSDAKIWLKVPRVKSADDVRKWVVDNKVDSPSKAAKWLEVVKSSEGAKKWIDKGVTSPDEAKEWLDVHGVKSPDDANKWISKEVKSPYDAKIWLEVVKSSEGAKKWIDKGVTSPYEAKEWHEVPGVKFSGDAKKWIEDGIEKPEIAKKWCSLCGCQTSADAKKWIDNKFAIPEKAKFWYEAKFLPSEAIAWRRAGFMSKSAAKWAKTGIENPDDVKIWQARKFSSDKAAPWIKAKFDPSLAKKWTKAGVENPEAVKIIKEKYNIDDNCMKMLYCKKLRELTKKEKVKCDGVSDPALGWIISVLVPLHKNEHISLKVLRKCIDNGAYTGEKIKKHLKLKTVTEDSKENNSDSENSMAELWCEKLSDIWQTNNIGQNNSNDPSVWINAGWSNPKKAAAWKEAGWENPTEAQTWRKFGFLPDKAREWKNNSMFTKRPKDAAKYFLSGFNIPEYAADICKIRTPKDKNLALIAALFQGMSNANMNDTLPPEGKKLKNLSKLESACKKASIKNTKDVKDAYTKYKKMASDNQNSKIYVDPTIAVKLKDMISNPSMRYKNLKRCVEAMIHFLNSSKDKNFSGSDKSSRSLSKSR